MSSKIEKSIQEKLFLVNSFLYSTSLNSDQDRESKLKHAVTSFFLQSIILELIIKMLYEIDKNESAPFTHNIFRLFGNLDTSTKEFLKAEFNKARERKKSQFEKIDSEVQFQSLEEVLKTNEVLIKDFKYNAKGVKTNSATDGIFYQAVLNFIKSKVNA